MARHLNARNLSVIKDALIGRRHDLRLLRERTVFDKPLLDALDAHLKDVNEAYDRVVAIETRRTRRTRTPRKR